MIIGVSGKIGAGKDVIGMCLKDNYSYAIIKFADKIKQIACLMTNTPMDLQTSQKGKATYLEDWGMTVREFQQKRDQQKGVIRDIGAGKIYTRS